MGPHFCPFLELHFKKLFTKLCSNVCGLYSRAHSLDSVAGSRYTPPAALLRHRLAYRKCLTPETELLDVVEHFLSGRACLARLEREYSAVAVWWPQRLRCLWVSLEISYIIAILDKVRLSAVIIIKVADNRV